MKKILLATTAIVAMASVSSTASAAEKIALSVGGFMNHYVGVVNHDEVANDSMALGQESDTEVSFKGSTTLDNGLTVAVTVEIEGDRGASSHDADAVPASSSGSSADKSFLTVSSDTMGAITLGAAPHAADDFAVGAPMAGTLDFGDGAGWANVDAGASGIGNGSAVRDLGGNELKMKYVSPSFSGVTVGISYDAAANVNGNKSAAARNATDDASSIAAMYEGEISGTSVSADIARFHNNAALGAESTTDRVGLSVGMAGFNVGGSYNDINNAAANADGTAWELGVSYETGPYAVSAAYMSGKLETGAATSTKDTEWVLGASYDLGASVSLVGNYFSAKGAQSGAAALASNKISGLVAGIEVGF